MTEEIGEVVATKHVDGTVTIERADPIILVSKSILEDPGAMTYVDGVLTLDPDHGKYRYRRIRSHDEHADVFHRITPDEAEEDTP